MHNLYITSHSPQWTTPEKYLKDKLKILTRDFCITPTEEELAKLKTFRTQVSIDNAIRSVIAHHWDT